MATQHIKPHVTHYVIEPGAHIEVRVGNHWHPYTTRALTYITPADVISNVASEIHGFAQGVEVRVSEGWLHTCWSHGVTQTGGHGHRIETPAAWSLAACEARDTRAA